MNDAITGKIVGYEQLSVGASVVQLSKYKEYEQYGELGAYILVEGQPIRFKIDENPTASMGFPLGMDILLFLPHDNLPQFRMIAESQTTKVNVLYVEV